MGRLTSRIASFSRISCRLATPDNNTTLLNFFSGTLTAWTDRPLYLKPPVHNVPGPVHSSLIRLSLTRLRMNKPTPLPYGEADLKWKTPVSFFFNEFQVLSRGHTKHKVSHCYFFLFLTKIERIVWFFVIFFFNLWWKFDESVSFTLLWHYFFRPICVFVISSLRFPSLPTPTIWSYTVYNGTLWRIRSVSILLKVVVGSLTKVKGRRHRANLFFSLRFLFAPRESHRSPRNFSVFKSSFASLSFPLPSFPLYSLPLVRHTLVAPRVMGIPRYSWIQWLFTPRHCGSFTFRTRSAGSNCKGDKNMEKKFVGARSRRFVFLLSPRERKDLWRSIQQQKISMQIYKF